MAVTANGALSDLGKVLSSVAASGGADGLHSVRGGAVRVASGAGNAVISGHFLKHR